MFTQVHDVWKYFKLSFFDMVRCSIVACTLTVVFLDCDYILLATFLTRSCSPSLSSSLESLDLFLLPPFVSPPSLPPFVPLSLPPSLPPSPADLAGGVLCHSVSGGGPRSGSGRGLLSPPPHLQNSTVSTCTAAFTCTCTVHCTCMIRTMQKVHVHVRVVCTCTCIYM